jgi:hypothetical protein
VELTEAILLLKKGRSKDAGEMGQSWSNKRRQSCRQLWIGRGLEDPERVGIGLPRDVCIA